MGHPMASSAGVTATGSATGDGVPTQVNVPPGGMEGPDLQHDQIRRVRAAPDLRILRSQSGVTTKEKGVARSLHGERGPQRAIAPANVTIERET